jgi:hypothetical protein
MPKIALALMVSMSANRRNMDSKFCEQPCQSQTKNAGVCKTPAFVQDIEGEPTIACCLIMDPRSLTLLSSPSILRLGEAMRSTRVRFFGSDLGLFGNGGLHNNLNHRDGSDYELLGEI